MTKEELKIHCERQIEGCERWAKARGEKPSGDVYEEHKLILELLEQASVLDKIRAEIEDLNQFYVWATKFWQMRDDIKALPPVTPKAKSDVLDKIRAEIEDMYYIDEALSFDAQISREDVLKIIDKYRESE